MLPRRDEILLLLQMLPRVAPVAHHEAMTLIAERRLWGRGLGWVDVNLLASTLVAGTRLWTLDRRLWKAAQSLTIAWDPA
jgi:predicted nucleic acid-binding protein